MVTEGRYILRNKVFMFLCLCLTLGACGVPPVLDKVEAEKRYLVAKQECIARYPHSLALQSDCRATAADVFIRPHYRYGDLMTYAQGQRGRWARMVDRHEMSRQDYDRRMAQSEAAVSREEDRRNAAARTAHAHHNEPFTRLVGAFNRLFR